MKRTVKDLAAKFNTVDIETAAVQLFLRSAGITVKNNRLISDILNRNSAEIHTIKEYLQPTNDLSGLITLFEQLIPPNDRQLNGAFFTPSLITNFMAEELVTHGNLRICDPSCGCGAFLVACAKTIHEKYKKNYTQIFEEDIYGVDLLEYSVRRSNILLSLLAIEDGEDQERYIFNIKSEDSLKVNWDALFNNGKFDVVIGNPPYVKYQDLPTQLRKDLCNDWSTLSRGTYNLYFAFFELGLSLLKEDGKLGYIVPNNYFTSLAAVDLRRYLQTSKSIDKIIDFNHLMIFDVQTYTCITFLTNKNEGEKYILYERVKDRNILKNLDSLKFSKVYYEDLNVKKWRLLRESDQKNIAKIENQPRRLGHITDIHVGIATLKDVVYSVDGRTLSNGYYSKCYRGETFIIEEQITRPVVKISDFEDENSMRENTRRIIFPYIIERKEPKLITEDKLRSEYPQCYSYLVAAKAELATRDKGKGTYPAWYAYARTQGLSYYGDKLLTPTFSSKPRFMYDAQKEALYCNGYGIFNKDTQAPLFEKPLNLRILQKILNSVVMEYYVYQTSYAIEGGFPCYQKNFIELFGIPDLDGHEIKYIERENDFQLINKFLISKYEIDL